jgi:phosphopantothenoylcysteine decarboxylase/phosphopantothenate--cysteine ligase
MAAHPSEDIRGSLGSELAGRTVALCISGSVAAVRAPDVARLLMRHGARVVPVFSPSAQKLIGPELMEWATGEHPVTELTGGIEHVALAGNVDAPADLVLVAPATANTISKIACGIDDTPVTTVVTTAIGEGIPLVIVPAMHEPMYRHPILGEHIDRLKGLGVRFAMPELAEGKAKIAASKTVYELVREILSEKPAADGPLAGTRILITAGRTVEYLDPIRVFTNNSSGKMGLAIAAAAEAAGAGVTVILGKASVEPSRGVTVHRVSTSDEMHDRVYAELAEDTYDVFISCAAVSDWKPRETQSQKMATHGAESVSIELVPTRKIIDGIKERFADIFLVAFRAQHDLPYEQLIEDAFRRLGRARADLIAVNDVSRAGAGFEGDTNELYVLDPERRVEHIPLGSKSEVGRRLVALIAERVTAATKRSA